MIKTGIVCLSLLMLAQLACAASFDCDKASTNVEKMICADPELSKLDEDLSASYSKVLKESSNPSVLKQQQRGWMKERNNCSDANCVKHSYENRIKLLKGNDLYVSADEGTVESEFPQKPPKLRYAFCDKNKPELYCEGQTGKGYTVCEAYLKHLQTLTSPPTCEAPIPPGFKKPDWEEMDVMQHLDLAYQAEGMFLKKFGSYKHPNFEVWRQTFVKEIKEGEINPRMRKVKVTPNDKGDAIILAYTRDKGSCHKNLEWATRSKPQIVKLLPDTPAWRIAELVPDYPDPYWRGQGDVHFILDVSTLTLQEIVGRGSSKQMDLYIYSDRAYLFDLSSPMAAVMNDLYENLKNTTPVSVYSFDPRFPDKTPNLDLNHYLVGKRCQFLPE